MYSELVEELFEPLYDKRRGILKDSLGIIGGRFMILESMVIVPEYRGKGLGALLEKDILDVYGHKVDYLILKSNPMQASGEKVAEKYRIDELNKDIVAAQQSLNAYFEKRGFVKISVLLGTKPKKVALQDNKYIKLITDDELEQEQFNSIEQQQQQAKRKELENIVKVTFKGKPEAKVCIQIMNLLAKGVFNDTRYTPNQLIYFLGGKVKEETMRVALQYLDVPLQLVEIEYWYEKDGKQFPIDPKSMLEAMNLGIYLHEGKEIADANFVEKIRIYVTKNKHCIL